MGMERAHKSQVQFARYRDVADVTSASGQELRVFLAPNGRTDAVGFHAFLPVSGDTLSAPARLAMALIAHSVSPV